MNINRRQVLFGATALTLLFATGMLIGTKLKPLPPLPEHVHSPDEALPIPSFTLQDSHGRPYTEAQLRGQWSVLFFGYTHCPDVCPTTMIALKQFAADRVAAGLVPPQVVFISLDPHRDTPETLREFVDFFDPNFVALTGTPAELAKLALPISGPYEYEDNETGELIRDPRTVATGKSYHVHHSGSLFFVAPNGELAAYALPPHERARLATIFDILRERYARWF